MMHERKSKSNRKGCPRISKWGAMVGSWGSGRVGLCSIKLKGYNNAFFKSLLCANSNKNIRLC